MEFSQLSPCQFENMTFDLLLAAGMKNLVWRTPGADGGRDIEGTFVAIDFSKCFVNQSWYIECKRYSTSIDWPTVWKKISFADSKGADFILLVTNSNPSPSCENEISSWNERKRRPVVRVWRGYELEGILSNYPQVAAKYGLLGSGAEAEFGLQSLMFAAMKQAQSSYVSYEIGVSNVASLEANAALAELISARHSQIRTYGRILPPSASSVPPSYGWLAWNGSTDGWDEVGIRALLSMARYLTRSQGIQATSSGKQVVLSLNDVRFEIAGEGEKLFVEVANWADVEVFEISKEKIIILRRD